LYTLGYLRLRRKRRDKKWKQEMIKGRGKRRRRIKRGDEEEEAVKTTQEEEM
jgi:hypothetical protein